MCREARQQLCQGETQGWGERNRHRGRHSPQNRIKMSQLYQLMTRGHPGRCQCFCLTFPASYTFPDGKLLQQKSQTWLHTREAGELARLAVMPSRGVVLPGTVQTWWCRTQTRCMPATPLPAWLSRCPLPPTAGASSPRSSQLLCSDTSRSTSVSLAATSHPPRRGARLQTSL